MQLSLAELEQSHWRTRRLNRTLLFWITSAAFIAMLAPTAAVFMRGQVGFTLLIGLAVVIGALERSLGPVLERIREGMAANKLLVAFALWYAVGVIANLVFRGNGLADWRFMIPPIMLLLGLGYTFAYATDEACYREFQIVFILIMGVQAYFIANELSTSVGIAREMWMERQGAWEFGNQTTYTTLAILLPMLVWRAVSEHGRLRLALLAACLVIGAAVSISSFGIPLFLLLIGGCIIAGAAIFSPLADSGRITSLAIVALLVIGGYLTYQFTFDNQLMAPAYSRIENVLRDPSSGGYTGADLQVSRWRLAEISITSFVHEPLLGAGGGSTRHSPFVGGHSSFLDTLGAYGLFGGGGALFGLILLMLVQAVLRFWHERTWETLLGVASVVMLAVAGVVNPNWEGTQPIYVLFMARPFFVRDNASAIAPDADVVDAIETPNPVQADPIPAFELEGRRR